MNPMVTPLYHIGQFLGFAGSSSSSQSTSKSGSVGPVVPTEVPLQDAIDICWVRTLSGLSCCSFVDAVSATEPFEGDPDSECADCGVGSLVVGADIEKARAQRFNRQEARQEHAYIHMTHAQRFIRNKLLICFRNPTSIGSNRPLIST